MISDYQLKHPLFGRKPSGAAALLLSSFCPFWLSTTSYLTYWISDVHTLLNTWFEPSGSSASPTLFFLSFYNAQNASSVYLCVGVRVRAPETTSCSRASLKCNMHLKFNELICTLCKPFSLPQPPSSPVCVLGARRRDGRHKRSIFFSVERSAWFEIGLSSVCVCAGSPTTTTHPNTASSTHTHTHTQQSTSSLIILALSSGWLLCKYTRTGPFGCLLRQTIIGFVSSLACSSDTQRK